LQMKEIEWVHPKDERVRESLLKIFLSHFHLGLTAFGFAILPKLKAMVLKNHWLTEEEMEEGLALVQLYPGPIMVDFTVYTGYKLRGVPGAFFAILGFVTPSLILMLLLSMAYFASGNLPWVSPLFLGLEAIVVGIIFHVTLDFGGRVLKGPIEASISVICFILFLFKANPVLIVLASLLVGAGFARIGLFQLNPMARTGSPEISVHPGSRRGIVFALLIVFLGVLLAFFLKSQVGSMVLSFFKIGSVAFGNGLTILPLVQRDVIDVHHWLTMREFVDGIALGQITPGPFLITATFIGYKVGGVWAALFATFAMFSPSFVMTLIFSEIFLKIKTLRVVKGALHGVLAAFVGLLALMVLQLGGVAINGPKPLALAALSFVAVHFFKWDVLWIFIGGLSLWGLMLFIGI